MLSESTPSSPSGAALILRRAIFSRARHARITGMALGALLLALTLGLVYAAPAVRAGLLLALPVAMLSWFGGPWVGRAGAIAAAGTQLAVDAASGPATPTMVVGAIIAVLVLSGVAWAVPVLRFAAQGYREHAQTDPLTNLGNRRFFREVAAVELNRTRRYSRPLSLVYLEADAFEQLRHVAGHAEADELLIQMASVITGALRTSDVVARLYGAEFAILLPETDGRGAQVVADKLREHLSRVASAAGYELHFRAAVVGFEDGPITLEALLRQADETMLAARRGAAEVLAYRDYVHPPMQLV